MSESDSAAIDAEKRVGVCVTTRGSATMLTIENIEPDDDEQDPTPAELAAMFVAVAEDLLCHYPVTDLIRILIAIEDQEGRGN